MSCCAGVTGFRRPTRSYLKQENRPHVAEVGMQLKKLFFSLFCFFLIGAMIFVLFYKNGVFLDTLNITIENPFVSSLEIPEDYSQIDSNNNGIPDPLDIVNAARKEVEQRTR